jgi:thymidylate synthase (FAD)
MDIKITSPSVEILTPIEEIKSFEKRIERIGRVCYKSENKTTEISSKTFIKNIIKNGHESVLEHCSISFLLCVSRTCSHQLVRHRIASYSQESQRYVNYKKKNEIKIILPDNLRDSLQDNIVLDAINTSIQSYEILVAGGIKPEDARYLLPNCVATNLVCTFNLRELRHVIKIRTDNSAQHEIRKVFKEILELMKVNIPIFFEDIF